MQCDIQLTSNRCKQKMSVKVFDKFSGVKCSFYLEYLKSETRLVSDKGVTLVLGFLPLDEAVAFRAVFAIVSGSDGGGGRERFRRQLNNHKTVRDRPYVSIGG